MLALITPGKESFSLDEGGAKRFTLKGYFSEVLPISVFLEQTGAGPVFLMSLHALNQRNLNPYAAALS
ncbi:MAG: hypothetical protein SCI25_15905 [Desulfuromonadales bacterium]|nr:hypothetical protein [Desulfuromonadales bacterium]